MIGIAVLAATVPQQDRTGPTIVFVVTTLIVVILLGVMIRRASKSAPHRQAPAMKPDDPTTEPDDPADS